jgi:hypothetical protein
VILLGVKLGLGLLPTTLGKGRIPSNDEREEVKAVELVLPLLKSHPE